jgi:hypothetical protein
MFGQKLRIEQPELAHPQPRDERRQRAFRGVGSPCEHAFAEERRAELDAVQPAGKLAILPAQCRARGARGTRR